MSDEKQKLFTAPSSIDLIIHTLSLAELIDGARNGFRNHIGELQRRFGPSLLRKVSSEDSTVSADGILSEVFMRLPTALLGYEEEGRFEGWLWVIARNILRDRARERQRLPDQFPHSDFDVPGAVSVAGALERNDLVQRLTACLAERQREAWLLNLAGYSDQEVADQLGLSANAAAQLLYRARNRIREEAAKLGLTPAEIRGSR